VRAELQTGVEWERSDRWEWSESWKGCLFSATVLTRLASHNKRSGARHQMPLDEI
jgi:hypothetical protein